MPVELFRIGEAPFDRFLAALVDGLSLGGETMGIDAFPICFPDMPGDGFDVLGVAGALSQIGTGAAKSRFGTVFAIPLPVGGAVAECLAAGTVVDI